MGQHIIMNYTVSPSRDDLEVLATSIIETLPEELLEQCESINIVIEDLADEVIEQELDLDEDERRLAAEFPDGSRVLCSRAGSSALRQRARMSDA